MPNQKQVSWKIRGKFTEISVLMSLLCSMNPAQETLLKMLENMDTSLIYELGQTMRWKLLGKCSANGLDVEDR